MGKRRRLSTSSSSSETSEDEMEKLREEVRKLKKKYKYMEKEDGRHANRPVRLSVERYRSPQTSSAPSEGSRSSVHPVEDDPPVEEDIALVEEDRDDMSRIVHANPVSDQLALDENVPPLSAAVLQALGKEVPPSVSEGGIIHRDIATRWKTLLKKGLGEELRSELILKYPPLKNCPLTAAPKLNLEIKAAINEAALKRDERLANLQGQIGTGLAALGQALSLLIEQEEGGDEVTKLKTVEVISDAAKLLADAHYQESESRRALVSLNLKKELASTLTEATCDEWLFGENLSERVKTAKTIEKSGQDLKKPVARPSTAAKQTYKNPLNSRAPLRQMQAYRLSGQKQHNLNRSHRQDPKNNRPKIPQHPYREKYRRSK